MENKNNSLEILLKALEDFKSQYPMSTSGDLQTFIIGWTKAVKILSLNNDNINDNINANSSMDYTIDNNTYNASGEKEYQPSYNDKKITFGEAEELFLKLFSELRQYTELGHHIYNIIYCNIIYCNNNRIIKINQIDKTIAFSHILWDKFERRNSLNFTQTREFLETMTEKHLLLNGYKIYKWFPAY